MQANIYIGWCLICLALPCLVLHRFVSRFTKPVNAISNKWTRFIYRTQKHTNFIHRIIKMHTIRIVTSFVLFIDFLINYARIKMLEITIWIFVACWLNAIEHWKIGFVEKTEPILSSMGFWLQMMYFGICEWISSGFFGYDWAVLTSSKYSQISLRFRVGFVLLSHFCPSFCLILTFPMFHSLVITFLHPVLFCHPRLPLKFKSTHHSKLFQPFSLNFHLFSSLKIIFIAIHLLQWRRKVFRSQNAISRVFPLRKTQI